MKKRVVSIELLRMLAMMMVVMLHFLDKGGILPDLTKEMSPAGYVAWGMECMSIVAVNVYMLISGYFLVESGFKPGRLVELICQVLFYTILVPLILGLCGFVDLSGFSIYNILLNVLPVQMIQYWFVTAYVIMYLFSPVLGAAVKSMKQKQLQITIIALLTFFSLSKTVLPVELAVDNRGNDALWFLCVFLAAAYIRLYGLPFMEGKKGVLKGLGLYLAGCAGIYVWMFTLRLVYLKTGSLDHLIKIGLDYNHLLNIMAAVGLFYLFKNLNLSAESWWAKMILKAAPYSFGVYLFHEQLQMRYLWPRWFGAGVVGATESVILTVAGSLLAVIGMYLVGTVVDMGRGLLFGAVKTLLLTRKKKA